jgi:hypothetical protein
MTFQPVVPFGGSAGWSFLQRTREAQQAAFDNSAINDREKNYFAENIGKVNTAEDLVNDRELLSFSLSAFGLEDDINNKFFIQKILENGTLSDDSLANRLSDKRYFALSEAFGFGDVSPPRNKLSDFADRISSAALERRFEVAVGEQNSNMRLALGLERELREIVEQDLSNNAMWFTVMANPPLRTVFETALSLPSSIGALDIDRQLDIFSNKAAAVFGDPNISQFSEPEKQDELLRLFLARSDGSGQLTASTGGSIALAILQS